MSYGATVCFVAIIYQRPEDTALVGQRPIMGLEMDLKFPRVWGLVSPFW